MKCLLSSGVACGLFGLLALLGAPIVGARTSGAPSGEVGQREATDPAPRTDEDPRTDPAPAPRIDRSPAADDDGEEEAARAARVEGDRQCYDCHRSEYDRWTKSKHAARSFSLLRNPSALEYAEGIVEEGGDVTRASVCVACHGTPRTDETGGSHPLTSVSCEACHNPSGGESGWLNPHAVYGPPGTRREQETAAHYRRRSARCAEAGQIRSADTYELAKKCLSCHVVSHEKLLANRHPVGGLDFFVDYFGEIRHNYHLNQQVNAEVSTLWLRPVHGGQGQDRTVAGRKRQVVLVGALAKLETALRNLAAAGSTESEYGAAMSDLTTKTYRELVEDLLRLQVDYFEMSADEVRELDEEDKQAYEKVEGAIPEVTTALRKTFEVYDMADAFALFDDESTVDEHRRLVRDAADEIGKAARHVSLRNDGSGLTFIEEPEVPDDE